MFIVSSQAGLIVKLLMKLSGQMTPNDKVTSDKYAYGWKTIEDNTAAKDLSAGSSYWLSSDCNNSGWRAKSASPQAPNFVYSSSFHTFTLCVFFDESYIFIACKYVYLMFCF